MAVARARVLAARLGNQSIAVMELSATLRRVNLLCTQKCSSLHVPNLIATPMMMPPALSHVLVLIIQSHFVPLLLQCK